MTEITKSQEKTLKTLIKDGKSDAKAFNGNTIKALASRGFVKTTENKKGVFVIATAKGKKILN